MWKAGELRVMRLWKAFSETALIGFAGHTAGRNPARQGRWPMTPVMGVPRNEIREKRRRVL